MEVTEGFLFLYKILDIRLGVPQGFFDVMFLKRKYTEKLEKNLRIH